MPCSYIGIFIFGKNRDKKNYHIELIFYCQPPCLSLCVPTLPAQENKLRYRKTPCPLSFRPPHRLPPPVVINAHYCAESLKAIKMKMLKTIEPKRLFLGIPLAILFWELFFGIILGYLSACFLSGKEAGFQGKIKSLIFNIGRWKIHFHHWLYCSTILISLLFIKLPLPQLSFGILGGLILQGIVCYPDWHRVIIRRK